MLAAAVLKHRADAVVSYTKGGASARTPWAADIWGEGDICPPPERWWWWWVLWVWWVGWGTQQGVCGGRVGRGWVGNSIVHRPNIDIL